MDFQQIRDFVNPAVAQATGLQEVENLSMPVPVAYVPVQLVIDGALSLTSENPVQNKVIAVATQQLDGRITAIEGQFSEGVTEAVNNWLAAHPEATTTVQDGAITYAKLDTNLKGEVDQISDLKSAIKAIESTTKNLWRFPNMGGEINGINYAINADGSITLTGTATAFVSIKGTLDETIANGTDMTLSYQATAGISNNAQVRIRDIDNGLKMNLVLSSTSGYTNSSSENRTNKASAYTCIEIANGQSVNTTIKIQYEKGLTVTAFESPFTAIDRIARNEISKNSADITSLFLWVDNINGRDTYKLVNGFTESDGNGFYGSDGTITSNSGYVYSEDYIPVAPGKTYSAWTYTTYVKACTASVAWYDINKTFLSRSFSTSVTAPANAYFCRISLQTTNAYRMFIEGTTNPGVLINQIGYEYIRKNETELKAEIEDVADSILLANNADYNFTDVSVTEETGYINKYNAKETSASWKYYEVSVEGNAIYQYSATKSSAAYGVMVFDKNGVLIKTIPDTISSGTEQLTGIMRVPADAKSIIINSNQASITLKKAISIKDSGSANSNILLGKKLYCGGDSITEAVGVGSFGNGYKKSYAGFVAVRNNMTYVSDGIGGSTMGNVTVAGSSRNGFCVSRYQNIPADADYITLWFGWNDYAYGGMGLRDAYCYSQYGNYYDDLTDEQKAEVNAYKNWSQWLTAYVGTIDSDDDTTWAGAWNKVLAWLLNNRSSARIGVVIAYGISNDLANMLISLCEKYGIGYIKAYDPHEFFSVGHSQGIGSDQATKRKQLYTLDNTHPNELGYEMMSSSYEQFLRDI